MKRIFISPFLGFLGELLILERIALGMHGENMAGRQAVHGVIVAFFHGNDVAEAAAADRHEQDVGLEALVGQEIDLFFERSRKIALAVGMVAGMENGDPVHFDKIALAAVIGFDGDDFQAVQVGFFMRGQKLVAVFAFGFEAGDIGDVLDFLFPIEYGRSVMVAVAVGNEHGHGLVPDFRRHDAAVGHARLIGAECCSSSSQKPADGSAFLPAQPEWPLYQTRASPCGQRLFQPLGSGRFVRGSVGFGAAGQQRFRRLF